jgi:hypothetical protein
LTPIEKVFKRLNLNTNTGCLEYTGAKDRDGYGRVVIISPNIIARAHRIMYSHFYGEISEGMLVCHKCDNPPCCNIDHLFLGTIQQNNSDRDSKGRGANVNGCNNPASKLSEDQVQQIHLRYSLGESMINIATEFDVCFQNVSLIVRGINRPESFEAFHGFNPPKNNPKPRLNSDQLYLIRKSTLSCAALSKEFGVSTSQISRIRTGKRCKPPL